MSNVLRALTAQRALLSVPERYSNCDEDSVVDLLTDLLHFAKENEMDPTTLLERAQDNFEEEAA